jgi:hypothetical protein
LNRGSAPRHGTEFFVCHRKNADLALRAREVAALTSQEFAAFFNAGYCGLYHETPQQIRERKGRKSWKSI